MNALPILALIAGIAIALQASMNAQLSMIVKNAMFSTMVAFVCSSLFITLAFFISGNTLPSFTNLKTVPVYLWFSGALSAFGVGLFYYLIPKMGVGSMMSFALTGQIVIAMLISHFGWFDLPIKPLNVQKMAGVVALISGVILVNYSAS